MKIKRNLPPNFLIGGTAAGGTSFLSAILVQHPQIYLPKLMRPEPHYFYKSWEYEKGVEQYLSQWFAEVPEQAIAIGERSSSYLFGGRLVAEKIAKQFPAMKFIFLLRNPIERTWANYRFTVLQGMEEYSFEDALKSEAQRVRDQSGIWAEIQPYNYTGRGLYASQLKQYLEFFPRENILLVKSEFLSSQTDAELRKIYTFLGLTITNFDYERAPDHTSANVIDARLQMDFRKYFGSQFDLIIEAVRKNLPVEDFVSNSEDRNKIELLARNITGGKVAMPQAARQYLAHYFLQEMKELVEIVDFDISDWK
jgi:hypothetical protein